MQKKTIYPQRETVLKLSLIIFGLLSVPCFYHKNFSFELWGLIACVSFFVILVSYSCRITYNSKEIRQYRCFFFFTRFNIAEISDIKYLPFSKKGRARVLEVKLAKYNPKTNEGTKRKRKSKVEIKDIFVALYSIESANEIINFVRQNNNIQTPLKLANNKSIFLSKKNKNGIIKFFFSIATILVISLIIKSLS